MPGFAKVIAAAAAVAFVAGGVLYCLRPRAIQRIILRRMQRGGERPSGFVAGGQFLWFVRIAGLLLIAVGLRALYTSGFYR